MKICKPQQEELSVQHFTSSNHLPQEWDSFLPEGHFLHRKNLSVTESISLPDILFIYILIIKRGTPLLAAGFQVLRLSKDHVNAEMVKPYQHLFWKAYTSIARPKLLVGGHLFRHDVDSVYCADGLPYYGSYLYYHTAIERASEICNTAAILIKDMPDKLATYFQNYQPQYMMLRNDISMEMDIPDEWQTMEDYEAALKHKYSQRYRKIRKDWEPLTVKEFETVEVEKHKSELFQLYQEVTAHQQVRIGLLNEDFLPVLKRNYNDLHIWGIYEGSELIGFFSAWVQEDAFDMFYIGFRYEKNREYSLYFNILFFSIEQAIAFRKSKLILGRTALDAKARLGCKPVYLSTFLYIKNSLIRNRVLQTQKNTSEKEGAWESRHPFGKGKH